MNKSISAFTIGLIFSLIGAACSYIFYVVFVLIGAFASGPIKILSTTLPFINMATFGLAFFGCWFCLSKPRIGGILMLISSILSLVCIITLFIVIKTFDIVSILFMLPTLFILIASIIALRKKKVLE